MHENGKLVTDETLVDLVQLALAEISGYRKWRGGSLRFRVCFFSIDLQ